jgi:hypothetical protein
MNIKLNTVNLSLYMIDFTKNLQSFMQKSAFLRSFVSIYEGFLVVLSCIARAVS